MYRLLFLCLTLLLPTLVSAGAWPRAEGQTFVASSYALLEPDSGLQQQDQTFYVERGLKKQFTLGFSGSFNLASSGEGHVFLRFPPRTHESGALTAYEFGIGAKTIDAVSFQPFLKAGLSWSKGITLRGRSGWVTVDGALFWDLDDDDHRAKLDASLGVTLSDRFKLIGQGFAEISQTGESLTLAPSLVYGLKLKKGQMNIQVGLERKFGEDARTGLRVGIWSEF